jgi:hypothetical protein
MKICILILSTNNKSYDCFKYAIRSTWLSDFKNKSIDCFFYEGDSDTDQIIGDTIYLSVKDEIKATFYKFYKCLEFLHSNNRKYDLYFRANLSCYIDVVEFMEFINYFNLDNNTFSGKLGGTYLLSELTLKYKSLRNYTKYLKIGKKISFYSGAGFFIGSRKVEFILKYGNRFKNAFIVDDVLIGMLLLSKPFSKLKNNILKILEIKIDSSFKLSEYDYFNLINNNHLFFYRFKNYDRLKDCEYILKFANPSFRKELLLNGFNQNELLYMSKIERTNFDISPSITLRPKCIIFLEFCRLIFYYFKIFTLINFIRFSQKMNHNLNLKIMA